MDVNINYIVCKQHYRYYKKFIASKRLAPFGFTFSTKDSSTAVLIKIIIAITTFQLKFPPEIQSSFSSIGSPIQQMAYSFDCFLVSLSDISIIYFRIIWSLMMAFLYLNVFYILLEVGLLSKKIKFNISMITTAPIYIFIFLQPNLIQALISLVSFRRISDLAWIQGNVSYRYDTSSHKQWIFSFCLPLQLIIQLIIPLLMYYGIHRSKKKIDTLKVRQIWGYLFNEYKLHAYYCYWEFIKIIQKEFIIIVLSYYEDYIAIKASLVFLFIFAYNILTTSVTPYMTGELNQLDKQSTTICAVSIILGSSIYTAQSNNLNEIVYPFYTIIAVINIFVLLKIVLKIIQAYLVKLHNQIDKVKEFILLKFCNSIKRHPFLYQVLQTAESKQQKINLRFVKLKQHLILEAKKIIQLKKKLKKDEKNNFHNQTFEILDNDSSSKLQ